MHLDHRIGSLEKGKDADFVVLSGAPFSVYTRVKQTWIDGKKVFDEATDRAYRDGGFMLAAGETLPSLKVADELPLGRSRRTRSAPAAPGNGADGLIEIRAGRIHTAAGNVIENGRILIKDGRITEVGPSDRSSRDAQRLLRRRGHARPDRPLLCCRADRRVEHPGRPGSG